MKLNTHTIHGLASSLLLNVGLTKFAEKLDPLAVGQTRIQGALGTNACTSCLPCNYVPRRNC